LTVIKEQKIRLVITDLEQFVSAKDSDLDLFTRDEALLLIVDKTSATAAEIRTRADLNTLLCQTDIVNRHFLILPPAVADKVQNRKAQDHREGVIAVKDDDRIKLTEELRNLNITIKFEKEADERLMALIRELDNNNHSKEEEEEEEEEGEQLEKVVFIVAETSQGALDKIETELLFRIIHPDPDIINQICTEE
jgi:hypothetical protein